jgi:hypothetical protein
MAHPLVIALFDSTDQATAAARALRDLGVPHARVSIVARSHDEEGEIARASGGSPGSELEDSVTGSRIGELSAHLLSAIALVMPGVGPILADGPLAADLAEAAGHAAGGIARALGRGGLEPEEAERWERRIQAGSILVGAHVDADGVAAARAAIDTEGPTDVLQIRWAD